MYLPVILSISVLSLIVAAMFARQVLRADTGTAEMQVISNAIKEGAEAFLRRQYKTIYAMAGVLGAVLFLLYVRTDLETAWKTTVGFLTGALCSGLAGFIGMFVSIRANIRVASASRTTLNGALQLALRGGAVSGLTVVAMSLLGVGGLFYFYGGLSDPSHVPEQIVGFGFGASLVALFAQLGGGIYTKAADVGADLVGKVEAGIPEDDPRNPAVIADLVGDNVGDCAGRGADLFESTAAENIGAMILGVALFKEFGLLGILFPLMARAFGLIASILGVLVVRTDEDKDPMRALNIGYAVTTVLAMAGFYLAVRWMLRGNLWLFAAGVVGIITSYAFVWITQYYTEYRYRPVQSIAQASLTGAATNIITGFSVALECTAVPVLVISSALLVSYYFGYHGLGQTPAGGFYGTAIATMGMLSTAAYILAMDTFGPITDNAGGIIEMSQQPEAVRVKTDRLDAVGNTTKALTKGYAIGSAALAAFLLFNAYIDRVKTLLTAKYLQAGVVADPSQKVADIVTGRVDIGKVPVFVAALLGAMLVFLFSSFAIKAVGKAAYFVIEEVRRQFRENQGIMAGTAKPDYRQCVDIVTIGSLKAMVVPGLLAVGMPAAVGFLFRYFQGAYGRGIGAESVAALLMVGTIAGILMATLMNNGGGAWDNAKKWIETGQLGGKRSEAHKAAVVGDTVGDPFKDTAGPSLHVLIKLLSTITLVLAPLFI
jgi:K(+)-stimulated pyrophosphate-energized sodium pump